MRSVETLSLHLGECSNETLALMTEQEVRMVTQALGNYQTRNRVGDAEATRNLARTVLVQHATPCEWQHFKGVRPQASPETLSPEP